MLLENSDPSYSKTFENIRKVVGTAIKEEFKQQGLTTIA